MILTGYVKQFKDDIGIGFIGVDGISDVFVHFTDIQRNGFKTLDEGDFVEFELEESPIRKAKKVRVIG